MNRKSNRSDSAHRSNSGNSISKRGRPKRAQNGDNDEADNTSHLADPPNEVNIREIQVPRAVPNIKQHDLAPVRGGTMLDLDMNSAVGPADDRTLLEPDLNGGEEQSNFIIVPTYASWFDSKKVHSIERRSMPEFFKSCSLSTPETYMTTRNIIIDSYRLKPTKYLDVTTCTHNSNADICAIVKIHAFLEQWGLINHQVDPEMHSSLRGSASINHFHLIAKRSLDLESEKLNEELISKQSNYAKSMHAYNSRLREDVDTIERRGLSDDERGIKDNDFGLRLEDYFIHNLNFQNRGAAKLSREWDESETLALLEAIELYKDDWHKVCEHVGCRTQDECILHFLRLPIEDPFLVEDEEPTTNPSSDQYQPMPFSKSGNPIMSTIAFLASVIDPSVAASAARAALQEFSKLADRNESKEVVIDEKYLSSAASCSLNAAACKARQLASVEERKIKSLVSVLIDTQLKKLNIKMKHFEELDLVVDKERDNTDNQRKQLVKEQREFQEEQVRAEKFRAGQIKIENMINPDA